MLANMMNGFTEKQIQNFDSKLSSKGEMYLL